MQQGQRNAIPAEKFAEMKASSVPFEELALMAKSNVKLSGIEAINGQDAYAVVTGDNTLYYDVKSGLKVAESKVEEADGKKMTLMTYYKDYRDVKGVKFPYNIVKNVGIELDIKLSDIKINEGVTDADFK